MTYSKTEIAEFAGVGPSRVQQLITSLGLKPKRRNGALQFSAADLRKVLARRTKPGPNETTRRGKR